MKTDIGTKIKNDIDDMQNKVKTMVSDLGLNEFLKTIDWEKYKAVVNKALVDIEEDNRQ